MNEYLWFFITLAVALAGGTLLLKLNVPAGAMLGSLVAVGLLNILSGHALMPATVKILTRTVAGLFVGMSMNMEMVRNIKRLFKPVVMLVVLAHRPHLEEQEALTRCFPDIVSLPMR